MLSIIFNVYGHCGSCNMFMLHWMLLLFIKKEQNDGNAQCENDMDDQTNHYNGYI